MPAGEANALSRTVALATKVRSICASSQARSLDYFNLSKFEIVGPIQNVETFATGNAIHEIKRLRRIYGKGRWRKRKGIAQVRFENGSVRRAEIHWYEATGIGKKEFKIRYLLD